jgi:ribosomal protein S13
MARISGVDIPREKRLVVALTNIYGSARPSPPTCARRSASTRAPGPDLTDEEVNQDPQAGWTPS